MRLFEQPELRPEIFGALRGNASAQARLHQFIFSDTLGSRLRCLEGYLDEYFGRGGTNCGFHSYGQCKAAVSGVGGLCRPNPWAARGYNYRRGQRY